MNTMSHMHRSHSAPNALYNAKIRKYSKHLFGGMQIVAIHGRLVGRGYIYAKLCCIKSSAF
jgi:hypothetical protein